MYQVITDPLEQADFLIKLFRHSNKANNKAGVMGSAGPRELEK